MTQPPTTGQSAPPSTGFGSPAAAGQQGQPGDGFRPAGHAAPDWSRPDSSPDAPTTTLPVPNWTAAAPANVQSPQGGPGQAAQRNGQPAFTSTPLAPGPAGPQRTAPPATTAPGTAPGTAQAGTRSARSQRSRGPRRARLQLRHIDPWTVLKFSCVLAIALFFVWLIVIGVLYGVLDGAGIIGKINDTVTTLQSGNAKPPITAKIVFGGAAIIGVVNIVLFIALSTVGSVVYNLCADLVGGIEVTLSER